MVCDAVNIIDYCFFLMVAMTQSSMLFLIFLVNTFTQNVLSTVIQYSSSEIFYKTPKKTRVLFSEITVCRLATLAKTHFVLLVSRKLCNIFVYTRFVWVWVWSKRFGCCGCLRKCFLRSVCLCQLQKQLWLFFLLKSFTYFSHRW